MEKDFSKKIELKNLRETIGEQLRLHNEANKEPKLREKEHTVSEPLIEEDADLFQLDLRNFEKGSKLVKFGRKQLHREIRDWLLDPIQLKQTAFNQKVLQQFSEIFSVLEDINHYILFESQITECYRQILEREPDKEGLTYYSNQLRQDKITIKDFERILRNSKEYSILNYSKQILMKYKLFIKKPIFIIGVPRTGTTLLYNILCGHEKLAYFTNEDIKNWLTDFEQFSIKQYYHWIKDNNKKIPIGEEALFVFGKDLGHGLKHFGIPPKNSSKIPIEGDILLRKFFGADFVKDIPISSKIHFLKKIIKTLNEQSKPRFLCKAPQISMRISSFNEAFNDAKFINFTRDPRPTISSMLQRYEDEGQYPMEGQFSVIMATENPVEYNEMSIIEKLAYMYNRITEEIFKFSQKNPNSLLTMEYEKLISDPIGATQKILEFCELDLPQKIDNLIPPIEKNTHEKWKSKLSKEDERKIFQITENSIKKMNYPYSFED